MTRVFLICTVVILICESPCKLFGQEKEQEQWKVLPLNGEESGLFANMASNTVTATNGVMIQYGDTVLTADRATLFWETSSAIADGTVRIQRGEMIWASEHIRYDFKSRQIEAEQFRTGKAPVFAAGEGLSADRTNEVYSGTNAFITTDDISNPAIRIRAKYIEIVKGKRIVAHHATLYLGDVPVFYFPYYSRELGPGANNFNFVPGYRSSFGPFLLTRYNWILNPELDGSVHLDYRVRRGPGAGPDFNYHFGPWGEGTLRYYYTHDDDPHASFSSFTNSLLENRQRIYFSYLANPITNVEMRALVRYQNDFGVTHDFFESEYRQNPQPSTYFEANKYWQNFGLSVYAQPRVDNFYETVERLPEVKLTGYRQQILGSPLYYESETSAGYYRRRFADTNGPQTGLDYSGARADTYHQVVLPETFFGWLNVTPRVGGRFTYYSRATGPGAVTDDEQREILNTGAEVSFKASRVWPGLENKLFEVDGLRHIVEPSVNYVFVPTPNDRGSNTIPQFDAELPSLRLLPIDFPQYNSIDSVDSQNVLRFGLRNKLQTKRQGEVVDLLNWDLNLDWRLKPNREQTTFSDVYSDLVFRPRSWITLESLTRYDISGGQWTMALHDLTFHPNDVWSWTVGHFYLKDDFSPSPTALGLGNNLFTSSLFFRLNENWGFRATHRFEARDGLMEEQSYTFYRDLRSWTAALTFRLRDNRTGPDDFAVAFTFSLKAFPRFGLGSDVVRPYSLLGS